MGKDITALRAEIDRIDRELTVLLEQRLNIADQIADYKQKNHLPVLDPVRERSVIEKNCDRLSDRENQADCKAFFTALMTISRERQKRKMK